MTDLLNLTLGSVRKKVTITETWEQPIESGRGIRVFVRAVSPGGAVYKMNEVWKRSYKGELIIAGLFKDTDYEGNIDASNEFGKLMIRVGAKCVSDLIGKDVLVEPKQNGYMAIVAYDETS
jgi:hypothetical protein